MSVSEANTGLAYWENMRVTELREWLSVMEEYYRKKSERANSR